MKKILSLVLIVFLCGTLAAQTLPRIKILATGGTIAGKGTSTQHASYVAGVLPIQDLIDAVPGIDKIAIITGEQISSVGSQDMTIAIWLKLNKRINEIFKNNEADAIVITHGTDTQEETAYFLNLTVRYDNPVVLTGSMRPSTGMSADGPKNLFDAITVAASPLSKGRGVMVSFDESVYSGRDVVKLNTTHLNAFNAPSSGPLGQVYDGKVMYYMQAQRAANKNTPFDVSGLTTLPKVAIVQLYCDVPDLAINEYAKAGFDGVVVAGLGNGNLNKTNTEAVSAAISKGVIVCRSTRVPSGRVTLFDETDDAKLGTIVSDDLNPQKARILLMLGLTQTKDKKVLQGYFFKY